MNVTSDYRAKNEGDLDKMTSANNANGQSLDCKKQNLIDAIRSANPDGKKGTPNPRLLTLKPGDTIKFFDHVLSRKNKECTVQKIDSTNPNCPIELEDFF